MQFASQTLTGESLSYWEILMMELSGGMMSGLQLQMDTLFKRIFFQRLFNEISTLIKSKPWGYLLGGVEAFFFLVDWFMWLIVG